MFEHFEITPHEQARTFSSIPRTPTNTPPSTSLIGTPNCVPWRNHFACKCQGGLREMGREIWYVAAWWRKKEKENDRGSREWKEEINTHIHIHTHTHTYTHAHNRYIVGVPFCSLYCLITPTTSILYSQNADGIKAIIVLYCSTTPTM